MKFHDLTINNFLAITHAKISLNDRGLVLVEGINLSDTSAMSNGAGKSSIADALCWVWFGTTARGETGDDVINDKAGKNCSVSSVVVDGGLTFTATRHRKHKTGKNMLTIKVHNGFTETDLTKGTDKLTQEVATQIIGASLEVFTGSIYAGQERMPDLPAMTDKMLKILIEEAAGVTALENAYRKAREELGLVQGSLKDNASTITIRNMHLHSVETQITALNDDETTWRINQTAKITTLKDRLVNVEAPSYKILKAEVDLLDIPGLEAAISAVDVKINSVDAENKTLVSLRNALGAANNNLAGATRENKAALYDVERCAKDVTEVKHLVGCPCSSCGVPLSEESLAVAQKSAEVALTNALARQTITDEDVTACTKLQKSALEALSLFEATLTDLTAEIASRDSLSRSLSEAKTKTVNAKMTLTNIQMETARLKEMMAETSPYTARIAKAVVDQKVALEAVHESKAVNDKLLHKLAVIEEVVRVFGPTGVRARVLDEVTPYLNDQTARYLTILSDGNISAVWTTLTPNAKGELKEKFSIDVTNDKGGKKFGLISGGEKRKVRIATALALQDLVATRATKPIDIFIGDEIDDALDAAGLERLMTILEEKAAERGSVFIISHNDLKDYVSNVLTIEKSITGETKITETIV